MAWNKGYFSNNLYTEMRTGSSVGRIHLNKDVLNKTALFRKKSSKKAIIWMIGRTKFN
ncbi:hypothetical protein BW1_085_00040 [Bacillus mycoides NBRC 101238 = DSM 11821]|nr:hypothetical protein BW1_085_00040 [Bacillus mycoides NBRC 101238 = DSM 11821]